MEFLAAEQATNEVIVLTLRPDQAFGGKEQSGEGITAMAVDRRRAQESSMPGNTGYLSSGHASLSPGHGSGMRLPCNGLSLSTHLWNKRFP